MDQRRGARSLSSPQKDGGAVYRFLIIAILLRRNRTESQTLVLPAELRAEHAAGRNPINRSNSAAVFSPKKKIRPGMILLRGG